MRLAGHRLAHFYLSAGRWKAICACEHVSWGITRGDALDAHEDHLTAVLDQQGVRQSAPPMRSSRWAA